MSEKYNNVAVITARGGSKRIPRKNIKDFMGKPMIAYAIETAKKSGLFSEIMVSTEDQEIADIARKLQMMLQVHSMFLMKLFQNMNNEDVFFLIFVAFTRVFHY